MPGQAHPQNQLFASTWSSVFVEHATNVDSRVTASVGAGGVLVALVAGNPRVVRTAVTEDTLFAFEAALLNKVRRAHGGVC